MFIECKKHGRVSARINTNYDVYCPFCMIEGMMKYAKKEEIIEEVKKMVTPEHISMGISDGKEREN